MRDMYGPAMAEAHQKVIDEYVAEGWEAIYPDGSSEVHPEAGMVGGFGVYFGDHRDTAQCIPITQKQTNNRGELLAAIHATDWPPPVTPPRQPRLPKVNQPTFLFCAIPHQLSVPAAFQNFHSNQYAVYFVTDFHSLAVTSHILDAGVLVVPEASHLDYLNSVFADGGHLALSNQKP